VKVYRESVATMERAGDSGTGEGGGGEEAHVFGWTGEWYGVD